MQSIHKTSLVWSALALLAYVAFAASGSAISSAKQKSTQVAESVVLPASLQTILYLGDRYLAANIETTRVLLAGEEIVRGNDQDYLYRIHHVVSELNPCHEDNYYVANALLGWGGNVDAALDLLRVATKCRFWDEVPPFFLGHNLYFFKYEFKAAKELLFLAAERSPENRVALQRFGVMVEAEGIPDARMARGYLAAQQKQARDKALKDMLELRIRRLDGLIVLRDAQAAYVKKTGRPLEDPQLLISEGYLSGFPMDPLNLGYTYANGIFAMREVGVKGAVRPVK